MRSSMEKRLLRLELEILFDESLEHYKKMNKVALNKNARQASKIALSLGTLNSAKMAAVIRDMERESRLFKKRGRFMVRN